MTGEHPDQTIARLRKAADAEAAAMMASGRADAVGLTGSGSSGRVWPSSDVDILFMSDKVTERAFHWTVRDGIILHGVITPWPELEALRTWYPGRMIESASSEWFLDATWAMDELVAMKVLHDPSGRLQAMQTFMVDHRFDPEVVTARRPILLARAQAGHQQSLAAMPGDVREADWRHHHAADILAVLWLEVGSRITSHKELDAAIGAVGPALGVPNLLPLFRTAEGVDPFINRRPAIERAFQVLLDLYTPALDALLGCYPTGDGEVDREIADYVYVRHVIQSVPHALERSCLMHLASVRETLLRYDLDWVPVEAAKRGQAVPVPPGRLPAARATALETLVPAPWASRQRALDDLFQLTAAL